MKGKSKIIVSAIILAMLVAIGGYYGYQKINLDKRVQTSDQIMKDKNIKLSDSDKVILSEILKDNNLEYAYISHNNKAIMLIVKFKKGIQSKVKDSSTSKYTDKIKSQYKDKNINVAVIPNN